jgi:hypothetical protein
MMPKKKLPPEIMKIRDLDFDFEERLVTVIVERDCPEIEVAGEKIGPLRKEQEVELRYWIASELAKAGIVRFKEKVDLSYLYDLYWKEIIQPGRKLFPLPKDFYPKARRLLAELKARNSDDYEKALRLVTDIVNCRLKKIVALSSMPSLTLRELENFSEEERILYDALHSIIERYRKEILQEK